VAEEWALAMKTYGFAMITGHYIHSFLKNEANQEGWSFFEMETKLKYSREYYGHPLGG